MGELLMKSMKKQSEMNAGKVDAIKVEMESKLADAQREKQLLMKEHQQKQKAFNRKQAHLEQQLAAKPNKSAQKPTQTAKTKKTELEQQLQNANRAKDQMRSEMNGMKIQTEKAKRDSQDLRLRMRNL